MRLVSGDDSYPCGEHIEVTDAELSEIRLYLKSTDRAPLEELLGEEIMAAVKRQDYALTEYRFWQPGLPIYLEYKCRCLRRQKERQNAQMGLEVGD